MKICTIALACIAFAASAGQAAAQSCAAPGNLNTTNPASGNTCSGTNEIGTYCGVASSPQPEQIWSVTLGTGFTATSIDLTNTQGAGYTPALVLFQGTCANGDNCQGVPAVGTAGGNTSFSLTGVPVGSYFLAVTADPNAAATNCGTYNLAYTGTLPVKLQSFSVN